MVINSFKECRIEKKRKYMKSSIRISCHVPDIRVDLHARANIPGY